MTTSSSYAATITLTGIVKRDDSSVAKSLLSASCVRTAFSNAPMTRKTTATRFTSSEVGEARRGRSTVSSGRHAARTPPPLSTCLGASLRGLAVALATRRVDPLEKRALRVVEREEVDEADVLQHLGSSVAGEEVVVSQDREERRHGVGAHSAKRILGGSSHPPALVGEESRDRRRRVCSDDVSRSPCGMNTDEPLAVVEACRRERYRRPFRCAFRASRRPPPARSDPGPTSAR